MQVCYKTIIFIFLPQKLKMREINSYEDLKNNISNVEKITQKKEMLLISGNFLKNIIEFNIQSFENISFFDKKFNFYNGIPLFYSKKSNEDISFYSSLYKYNLQELKNIIIEKIYVIEKYIKENGFFEIRLFNDTFTKNIVFKIEKYSNNRYKINVLTNSMLITETEFKNFLKKHGKEKIIEIVEDDIKQGNIHCLIKKYGFGTDIMLGYYTFMYSPEPPKNKTQTEKSSFSYYFFSRPYDISSKYNIIEVKEYKEEESKFNLINLKLENIYSKEKNEIYVLSDYYLKILMPNTENFISKNGIACLYETELSALNLQDISNILNSIYESMNEKYYIFLSDKNFYTSDRYKFLDEFTKLKNNTDFEKINVKQFDDLLLRTNEIDNFKLNVELNYILDLTDKDKSYIIDVLDSLLRFGIISEYKEIEKTNKINITSNYIFSYENIKNLQFNYLFYSFDQMINVLRYYLSKYYNRNLDEIINKLKSEELTNESLVNKFLSFLDKQVEEIIFGDLIKNTSESKYLILRIIGKHKDYIKENYSTDLELFNLVEI